MGLNISSEIKEQIKALIVIELLLEYINQLATETILLQNIVKICKKEKHPQYNPSNQWEEQETRGGREIPEEINTPSP